MDESVDFGIKTHPSCCAGRCHGRGWESFWEAGGESAESDSGGWLGVALCALILLLVSGCFGMRTVYVPDGAAVRLRQSVKAKVWVRSETGKALPSIMKIPEGWYALPLRVPPGEK